MNPHVSICHRDRMTQPKRKNPTWLVATFVGILILCVALGVYGAFFRG